MAPVNSLLPAHGKLWYEYRGDAFFEIRQYQAAIAYFSRAIALTPQEIYSYRLRGPFLLLPQRIRRSCARLLDRVADRF
jgi:tetratricopeptide (TPR) repeat protein